MGFWNRLIYGPSPPESSSPRASYVSSGQGVLIATPEDLEAALRGELGTASGIRVTTETAMRVGAAYACIRLISGAVGTLPIHIKRRVDARTRHDASDLPLWDLMRRRPNRWQKPAQFKRMLQACVLSDGNGYALKVRSRGAIRELFPLQPSRVEPKQLDDMSVVYVVTRKNGVQVTVPQEDMLHLYGLTLNGFCGVSPLRYARESIAMAVAMDRQVGNVVRNGAQPSGAAQTKEKLSDEAFNNLKRSLEEYRAGEAKEGGILLLEEGLEWKPISLSPVDLQWIEAKKLSRSDIAMFFGVPPSMIGDNSGSDSNWGTGLEQKSNGFISFGLEDHLTMWEEAITSDLNDDPKVYARFNRAGLVRGDVKARWGSYVQGLQWGVLSPNEVRALEDLNPRDGGDIYYPPPNTAGKKPQLRDDDDDDEDI